MELIEWIIHYERKLSYEPTDEFEKYLIFGMQLRPKYPIFLFWYGFLLYSRHRTENRANNQSEADYRYIEFFEKAYENERHKTDRDLSTLSLVRYLKQDRDYYLGSMKQINHLIQLDTQPNLMIVEPQWEIYKITISFLSKGFDSFFCRVHIF